MRQKSFDLINPDGRSPLVLTCEHAAYDLPEKYQGLGISQEEIRRHIGWDIGARAVVEALVQTLDAPAVCSGYSRLLIDCNRDLSDHDLIIPESDGTKVPLNHDLSDEERHNRIVRFYRPYHEAIDSLINARASENLTLLSIHSFTPVLEKSERRFALGILFDCYEDLAQEVGQRLAHSGSQVRYNEPYSGYEGLIFSARTHGQRHGIVYLEIEINNSLITDRERAWHMGRTLGSVFQEMFLRKSDEQ
ncbi:MAG TPA: N-formylglutamate amidohydrolase [Candidatus Binatia bacterium]|jgi:predicted N-formylglutamate amidohydrolase|nr:N-formylglutamate amidohydrolase [Candidatus Binatia bacterium]